ncbi:MAG TPA: toll/interleukin-1 receptor domain-containing protein, partial [Woeseiaceae bacterium]|nr:toll/interleukin-1 receptor domain-containing protein [Woeseiaceae bacterium]
MSSSNTSLPTPPFKYRAFISYSSRDREVGERFQKALEDFRVPKPLRGRQTIAGTVGNRLIPIFRDRSDFESHADLGSRIEQALKESGALIILCSPASASSKWVNKEIATFKQMGKADRIFAVILKGEPQAWPNGVFPPCLSHRVNDAGKPTAELEPCEPLAVDVRQEGDGWEASVEKIAASLLGVSLTELRDRVAEAERHDRHVRQRIIVGVSTLAVVAMIAAIAAYLQRQDALVSQSRSLARLARPLIEQERYAEAQLLALEGLPASQTTLWPRPLDAYAEALLTRARYSTALRLIISGERGFMSAKFSRDGSRILTITRSGIGRGEVQVWDAVT